jgi:hypothetical protein
MGGQLNPGDVTRFIKALLDFSSHFIEGIAETIEDLPHAGRDLHNGGGGQSSPSSTHRWNPFKRK